MSQATLEEVEAPSEDQTDTLMGTDRCDQCGAQDYAGVIFTGDRYLLFCGHHFSKYETKLRETGIKIFDERWKLNGEPIDVSPM